MSSESAVGCGRRSSRIAARGMVLLVVVPALLATGFAACQAYEFAFQPNADRQGVHLRFAVEQPSKADILFVIDNSKSMQEEQDALASSIEALLSALAPQDTRYRIGIVSTDAMGFTHDCCGNSIVGPYGRAAKGNCNACDCSESDVQQQCGVQLRRPHDGVGGRLIAAYDAEAFDASRYGLDATQTAALQSVLPTGVAEGPVGANGTKGVRAVIDREIIRQEACTACDCTTCDADDTCSQSCAEPVAQALVRSYFQANMRGLGVHGFGWEEGLKAALLAVGIDPEDSDDTTAIAPAHDLTAPGSPNSFMVPTDGGTFASAAWVREDALLAIMFVSDEEDCSMPGYLMQLRGQFEESASPAQPAGSICYQKDLHEQFLALQRMHDLLVQKKGGSEARVAIGFIGGVRQTGQPPLERRYGEASDCVATDAGLASSDCSCLADSITDERWCRITHNKDGTDGGRAACQALAGSRYVSFAQQFKRRTFESICRTEGTAFGATLADFARIATLACFDLQDVEPAGKEGDNVQVYRTARLDAADGKRPTLLPQQHPGAAEEGWYYDAADNKICLTGLDRLVGDVYDIFILHTNTFDFKN